MYLLSANIYFIVPRLLYLRVMRMSLEQFYCTLIRVLLYCGFEFAMATLLKVPGSNRKLFKAKRRYIYSVVYLGMNQRFLVP